MGTTVTLDISGNIAEVGLQPEMKYVPTAVTISGQFGKLALHATDEQLADLAYVINTYLDQKRYSETPDQQLILNQDLELEVPA